MKLRCFHWLLAIALIVYSAVTGHAAITAGFAHSATKVLRDAKSDSFARQWQLSAARNEIEACQLVLVSDAVVSNVTVAASAFRHPEGRGPLPVELRKVEYVPNVISNTPYPDPLPPLQPLTLQTGQAQPVWISVRVPKDAAKGSYQGTVQVQAAGQRQELSLRLRVWDFTLPDTPASETAFGIDGDSIARCHGVPLNSTEAKQLYAQYYEMLLDHRISAYTIPVDLMSHRLLFWQQKRENVDGLLYWNTTYWNPASTQNPWTNMMTVKDINPNIRGDGSLMYPGKYVGVAGPVSSQRLEVIRDGLEDFDYLTLADRRLGPAETQRYVARLVRNLREYELNPAVLEQVRVELGAALE